MGVTTLTDAERLPEDVWKRLEGQTDIGEPIKSTERELRLATGVTAMVAILGLMENNSYL